MRRGRAVNLSGIVVVAAPGRLEEVVAALPGLPGVEVHHTDAAASRIVVVQEAPSIDDEVDGLTRIRALPGVACADLVYHYFADDAARAGPAPPA
jgi:nitrate reductase NapD